MKANKLLALGGLMAAGLLVNQGASAADCGVANLATLIAGAPCSQQDKIYDFVSSTIPTTSVALFNVDVQGGKDVHTVTISRSGLNVSGEVRYTIEIDFAYPGVDPTTFIQNVDLGSTTTVNGVTITKHISEVNFFDLAGATDIQSLVSTNGADNPGNLATNAIKLYVVDSVDVSGGGTWQSMTNTYIQSNTPVPVPGTLALFGLGLAGIGARIRNRKV